MFTKTNKLISLLKLVGDESRLNILGNLLSSGHYVSELISITGLSQSLISHHLKDLRDSNLVFSKKEGKWVSYFLTEKGKKVITVLNSIS